MPQIHSVLLTPCVLSDVCPLITRDNYHTRPFVPGTMCSGGHYGIFILSGQDSFFQGLWKVAFWTTLRGQDETTWAEPFSTWAKTNPAHTGALTNGLHQRTETWGNGREGLSRTQIHRFNPAHSQRDGCQLAQRYRLCSRFTGCLGRINTNVQRSNLRILLCFSLSKYPEATCGPQKRSYAEVAIAIKTFFFTHFTDQKGLISDWDQHDVNSVHYLD